MSLELAIKENTDTIKSVVELLKQFLQKETAPVAAPSDKKRKVATATPATTEVESGGTRFWHIAKHNTVYKQLPGMADCNISGALEVTETEYELQKAIIEQKVATPAPAAPALQVVPTPEAVLQEEPEAIPPSFADVVAEIRKYFKAFGNDKVLELLTHYGVNRVPELELHTAKYAEVIAHVQSQLGTGK